MMPPHCDTMDGPVVKAAQRALEKKDVRIILPYVKKDAEQEIERLFQRTLSVMKTAASNNEIVELAQEWFFENVVRLHRSGEGEPYTGLKPAGLSEGPIIPIAEKSIREESPQKLIDVLTVMVSDEVNERFNHMLYLKKDADKGVDATREYVEAMLALEIWSHKLYLALRSSPHEKGGNHGR
ncbi:MAG: hypothetical protein BWY00_01065 [Firmicutes bacterium ADurb.Bin153]|nr:MAG: hypothetical protein BWY00_01065 [Firmicutes bacterium ADurb.Bin153]